MTTPSDPPTPPELTSDEIAGDSRRRLGMILVFALLGVAVFLFRGVVPVDVGLQLEIPPTLPSVTEPVRRQDLASAEAQLVDDDGKVVARVTWEFPGGLSSAATEIRTVSVPADDYMIRVTLFTHSGAKLGRVLQIKAKTDASHTLPID